MTYTPHRYSPRSVYRFVPIIKRVLDQHRSRGTATVMFNPLELNLSIETAVARLRDAAKALSSGITTHPSVDVTSLKEVWPLYRVDSDGVNVLVAPRSTEQDEVVPIHTASGDALATLNVEDGQFVELVRAFAILLGRRLLQGQVVINGDLSENLQRQLGCDYDVVIIQDAPKQFHML